MNIQCRGRSPRRQLGLEQVVERTIVTRGLPPGQSVAADDAKADKGDDEAGSQPPISREMSSFALT